MLLKAQTLAYENEEAQANAIAQATKQHHAQLRALHADKAAAESKHVADLRQMQDEAEKRLRALESDHLKKLDKFKESCAAKAAKLRTDHTQKCLALHNEQEKQRKQHLASLQQVERTLAHDQLALQAAQQLQLQGVDPEALVECSTCRGCFQLKDVKRCGCPKPHVFCNDCFVLMARRDVDAGMKTLPARHKMLPLILQCDYCPHGWTIAQIPLLGAWLLSEDFERVWTLQCALHEYAVKQDAEAETMKAAMAVKAAVLAADHFGIVEYLEKAMMPAHFSKPCPATIVDAAIHLADALGVDSHAILGAAVAAVAAIHLKKPAALSKDEAAAVYLYTTPTIYAPFNHLLVQRAKTGGGLKKEATFAHLLTRALRLLPRPRGSIELFRGIAMSPDLVAKYTVGKMICWSAFTSTTDLKTVTTKFGGTTVLFNIRSLTARSIAILSQYPDEREWLIPPCTQFVVVTALHVKGRTEIVLQEIDSESVQH
jgi:hypothetical protein